MNKKQAIACRVRDIRKKLYGDHGTVFLARSLNIPKETWLNYERGVTMPAEVMLAFLDVTETDPRWLLSGEGQRTLAPRSSDSLGA